MPPPTSGSDVPQLPSVPPDEPGGRPVRDSGSLIDAGKAAATFLRRAAVPVTVIAESVDVLANDRHLDEEGAAAAVGRGLDGLAGDLAKHGVPGRIAGGVVGLASANAVVTTAAVEEVAKSGGEAITSLTRGEVQPLVGAAVRGALLGAKERVVAGVDAVGGLIADSTGEAERDEASRVLAGRLASTTPEQRAAWLERENDSLERATTLDPSAREAAVRRLRETYERAEALANPGDRGALPFGVPAAERIPDGGAAPPSGEADRVRSREKGG